jgi:hypothetical protein
MSRHPLRSRVTLLAALGLSILLAASAGARAADGQANDPVQTQTCNEPPALSAVGGRFQAQVTGKALKPGTTRRTNGTDLVLSPELDGWVLFSADRPFSFIAGGGVVSGTYGEILVRGADKRCKSHLQVRPQAGCVSKLVLQGYHHPLNMKLVADYRSDQGGTVASRRASRSAGAGSTITFELKTPVCAGGTSRWLLLNTSVKEVEPLATLVFVAPDDAASEPHPFHVPVVAP